MPPLFNLIVYPAPLNTMYLVLFSVFGATPSFTRRKTFAWEGRGRSLLPNNGAKSMMAKCELKIRLVYLRSGAGAMLIFLVYVLPKHVVTSVCDKPIAVVPCQTGRCCKGCRQQWCPLIFMYSLQC